MTDPVKAYALKVVAGTVPAGKYHRLACVRHLKDLQRQGTKGFPFRFVLADADLFVKFAQLLKHYKGEWAGQPIVLSEFQRFRLGCIFGWRHGETGFRRFTTAYNELPRKTGKSLEAAVVGLYCTFFEGEEGAEGYCLATKERQAADVVFHDMKRLVLSSGLRARITVQVKNLHVDATSSKFEPLGSDSETLDGLNPHCIITDELHAFKHRDLLDVMESATGARRNPLHYQITTAGDDPVSPCGDQHDYACKILEGTIVDFASERFFACIAHADPEDDWMAESTWKKANPHYGISVKPDDIKALALKARAIPAALAEFQQKRLNLWVNASAPCLSVDGWRKGQHSCSLEVFVAALQHEPCYVGIDLASKIDLCALAFVFPPGVGRPQWKVLECLWTPEETLLERARKDRVPYDVWSEQGWLTVTEGSRVDHRVIRERIAQYRGVFDIHAIGFDPWHADQIIDELIHEDGFTKEQVLAVSQTYAGMTNAEIRFKEEVLAGNVDARGCPVTTWAVSNVIEQTDGKGNIFFSKGKSRGRIDPVKAATIGMTLALKAPPVQTLTMPMFVGAPGR